MEQITLNAEFLFELPSKQSWISRVPAILPEKKVAAEKWVWVDAEGYTMEIGEDFSVAEEVKSYPVKVYRLIRRKENQKPDENKELYFIRTQGYSGNSLIWWRPNSQGYTINIKRAGKYTKEKTEQICSGSKTELGYRCDKVLNLGDGLFSTVYADYLPTYEADIDYREKSNK